MGQNPLHNILYTILSGSDNKKLIIVLGLFPVNIYYSVPSSQSLLCKGVNIEIANGARVAGLKVLCRRWGAIFPLILFITFLSSNSICPYKICLDLFVQKNDIGIHYENGQNFRLFLLPLQYSWIDSKLKNFAKTKSCMYWNVEKS